MTEPARAELLQVATPTSEQFNAARAQFVEAGYDVIPLRPKSKSALYKNWQSKSAVVQWHTAPNDANLGLRAGHGNCFIDADDKNKPGTFSNVVNWLEGLGYHRETLPIIQTASGVGRHVYAKLNGSLLGNYRNLRPDMGAGEFRFGPGSYVATYPDVIEGEGQYRLISGDIARLPVLDLKDIAALIDTSEPAKEVKPTPNPSRFALSLMAGNIPPKYKSRSEAEAALVLSLINSGFDYQGVKRIFETNPCAGHYREKHAAQSPKEAERWLYMVHQEMLVYSQNESPTRRTIRQLQELAEGAAWSKPTDKLIFLAHTAHAYRAGRLDYHASRRDLATEAGVNGMTATNTTKRLVNAGILSVMQSGDVFHATRYGLEVDKISHILRTPMKGYGDFCPPPPIVAENGLLLELDKLETSDAFRNGKHRLGRRAGQVYKLLFTDSLTAPEIAHRTGASLKTVQRVLKKLATLKDYKTGEVLEMVQRDEDGRWHSRVVDLEIVEAVVGTRGAREKQREQYQRERKAHERALALQSVKNHSNPKGGDVYAHSTDSRLQP